VKWEEKFPVPERAYLLSTWGDILDVHRGIREWERKGLIVDRSRGRPRVTKGNLVTFFSKNMKGRPNYKRHLRLLVRMVLP
jgi:hypothetical protein